MGVIKQGILGGFSGKVANVVGSSWKGVAVIKSLPLSVANPNTAGQQAQRGAMTEIVAAARVLLPVLITLFWNRFAQGMSGFNAFVKENIATFTTSGFTTFASFMATKGTLLGITPTSMVADASSDSLTFNWVDNSGTADALASDTISVVYWNATTSEWVVLEEEAIRSAATVTITGLTLATSDALKVYIFAARADYSKVSDSVYTAVTTQA